VTKEYVDIEYRPVGDLYHYTSLEAFTRILDSGVLRATGVQYLNDASEVEHGMQLIRSVAKQTANTCGGGKGDFLSAFASWVSARDILYTSSSVFVVCFSEARDQLSQWRGYAPHARGICFQLDAGQLVKSMQEANWTFQHCRYDERSQHALAMALINRLCRGQPWSGGVADLEGGYHVVFESMRTEIFQVAATIKNHHFSHEQEVRFISPVVDLNDPAVKFREGRTTLIPYVDFPISSPTNVQPIVLREVVIGPSPAISLTNSSVTAMIQQQAHLGKVAQSWSVNVSDIPYRDL
jgi:hypothetical protein